MKLLPKSFNLILGLFPGLLGALAPSFFISEASPKLLSLYDKPTASSPKERLMIAREVELEHMVSG
ncbi:MAG: hypothetical protein ACI9O0_000845 [Paracoccaceae bacterium]|jgi:hypothetical protein